MPQFRTNAVSPPKLRGPGRLRSQGRIPGSRDMCCRAGECGRALDSPLCAGSERGLCSEIQTRVSRLELSVAAGDGRSWALVALRGSRQKTPFPIFTLIDSDPVSQQEVRGGPAASRDNFPPSHWLSFPSEEWVARAATRSETSLSGLCLGCVYVC